jgi:hypothetical protein
MLSARHESGGKSGKNNNKSRRDGCKFAFLEVPITNSSDNDSDSDNDYGYDYDYDNDSDNDYDSEGGIRSSIQDTAPATFLLPSINPTARTVSRSRWRR